MSTSGRPRVKKMRNKKHVFIQLLYHSYTGPYGVTIRSNRLVDTIRSNGNTIGLVENIIMSMI